ncbi:lysozyme [Methylocystis sp. JR02]|uniref:lysozyme n=1 Tax=Methylocystis sp. JR02 TaxID=3046284 RepID=UPI0024B95C19|nr:lysozyme [Methylocystis sp. JR02]MDJ0449256.1 lysozyme [Methylocystis sp. JR02]
MQLLEAVRAPAASTILPPSRMSGKGRSLLMQREGVRTRAYRDTVGVLTIGVGHTSQAGLPEVTPGLVITRAQADAILTRDLRQYEFAVAHAVTVQLTQGQFDALVSLCFNIGCKGFRESTVVKRLNVMNYRGAADAILLWAKEPELKGRRKAERAQFLAATPDALGAPVRFLTADELHEEEMVSADYLRASGSRTLSATDFVKQAATTVLGADVVDGATRAKDALDQLRDAYAGFAHGADAIELTKSYWPLAVGLALSLVIACLAYLAWREAHRVQRARVEDAVLAPAAA